MRGGGRTTAGLNASSRRHKPSKPDQAIDQVIRTNAMARYRTLAAGLEKAAVSRSWCGSRPASEWAAIREAHAQARRDLEAFVKSLIDGGPQRT